MEVDPGREIVNAQDILLWKPFCCQPNPADRQRGCHREQLLEAPKVIDIRKGVSILAIKL